MRKYYQFMAKALLRFCFQFQFLFLFANFSCAQQHSPIEVPNQTSLEKSELKGSVKRKITHYKYRYLEYEIKEYNRNGMLVLNKQVFDISSVTQTYEYDNLNRLTKEACEFIRFSDGFKTNDKLISVIYSDNEMCKREYDENEYIEQETRTKYNFDSQGRLTETITYKNKYDETTHKLDTSYIDGKIEYIYEGDILKYSISYKQGKKCHTSEYDMLGHLIKSEGDEYSSILVWAGDRKIKDILYRMKKIWIEKSYDSKGREIEDKRYGVNDCDRGRHVVCLFKTIYLSDNEWVHKNYREYGTDDYKTGMAKNCYLKLEEEEHYLCERDSNGNIIKKYKIIGSDKILIEVVEYEYY